ncbi:MAG: glycosyltransferase family 2 protein, partial [Thermoplasmata archaeon]
MIDLPRVALVILNWNDWEATRTCLESVAKATYSPMKTYVVDNGSSDGSPDRIAEAFPHVPLLRLSRNHGYGGGMNAGIRAALEEVADYVLCLNNDMTVDPGFLEHLVRAASPGRVVPFPAVYQLGDPERVDSAGNRFHRRTGLVGAIGRGSREVPKGAEADYTELPFLPRPLLERIGGYDESYFAFYEDVDLCLRIRREGWR